MSQLSSHLRILPPYHPESLSRIPPLGQPDFRPVSLLPTHPARHIFNLISSYSVRHRCSPQSDARHPITLSFKSCANPSSRISSRCPASRTHILELRQLHSQPHTQPLRQPYSQPHIQPLRQLYIQPDIQPLRHPVQPATCPATPPTIQPAG